MGASNIKNFFLVLLEVLLVGVVVLFLVLFYGSKIPTPSDRQQVLEAQE